MAANMKTSQIVAAIGLVASVVGIFSFATGIISWPELMEKYRSLEGRMVKDESPAQSSSVTSKPSLATLSLSPDSEILLSGEPITPPLRYFDEEVPQRIITSFASPSGRYVFLALCGRDSCDDGRIVDVEKRGVRSLGIGKSGMVDWTSWSHDERYVLLTYSTESYETGLQALELETLGYHNIDLSSLVPVETFPIVDLSTVRWAVRDDYISFNLGAFVEGDEGPVKRASFIVRVDVPSFAVSTQ